MNYFLNSDSYTQLQKLKLTFNNGRINPETGLLCYKYDINKNYIKNHNIFLNCDSLFHFKNLY